MLMLVSCKSCTSRQLQVIQEVTTPITASNRVIGVTAAWAGCATMRTQHEYCAQVIYMNRAAGVFGHGTVSKICGCREVWMSLGYSPGTNDCPDKPADWPANVAHRPLGNTYCPGYGNSLPAGSTNVVSTGCRWPPGAAHDDPAATWNSDCSDSPDWILQMQ